MNVNLPIGTKCCVKTCENVISEASAVEFHRFPTDPQA